MVKRISELCALNGVSGREDEVRSYIAAAAAPFADELITDALGNLLVFKKGRRSCGKTLMLAAHMDEVGVIIRSSDDGGYLKFDFVGGVDRRVAIGKRVFIGDARVPGVIGVKPYHLLEHDEEKSVPKTEELSIDIGAPDRESALKLVRPGDVGAFDGAVDEFGEGFLRAKALDDRVGCAVLLELIERTPPVDAWFAFTAQEEVGTRGAFGAAFRLKPDIALVVEGTTAADIPSTPKGQRICSPGKGAVIPFMDKGAVYDRELFERLCTLAEQNGVPWQLKEYVSGGTDASAIQRAAGGARAAGIAAAVRYIHSPSGVACIKDFDALLRLSELFLDSF